MTMIMMTENLVTKITMSNMIVKNMCVNQVDINKQLLNEEYDEVQYAIDWTLENSHFLLISSTVTETFS